jgi:hypothetical protein
VQLVVAGHLPGVLELHGSRVRFCSANAGLVSGNERADANIAVKAITTVKTPMAPILQI